MSGKSTQDSTTSQTSNQTQNSTTNPWAVAQPALQGILGQLGGSLNNTGLTGAENNAFGTLQNNASNYGSTFGPQISNYATTLLNGGGATGQAGNVQQNFQDYGSSLGNLNSAAASNTGGYQGILSGLNSAAGGNLSDYRSALGNANGAAGQTLSDYNQRLSPMANGSLIGNNPALQAQLDTLRADITNQTNGSFAAAGRDFSGANSMALGRGITQGLAPVLADQYNRDIANQRGAADALYGAGNTTAGFQVGNAGAGFNAGQATGQFQAGNAGNAFGAGQSTGQFQAGNAGNLYNAGGQTAGLLSGLQQQYLANQGQGVQASQDAMSAQNAGANATLQAEAQRRGIPVQALGLLAQIGIPIAGLGSTSSGTSTGTGTGTTNQTNQMSGVDQFSKIAGGLGNIAKLGAFL